MLETRQMIHTKTDNITTLISINNYGFYQKNLSCDADQTTYQSADQMHTKVQTNNKDKNLKNDLNEKEVSGNEGRNTGRFATLPISFNGYKLLKEVPENTSVAVQYFLNAYKQHRGEAHPNLKEHQWDHVKGNMLLITDEQGRDLGELDQAEIEIMINKYFRIEFQEGCNYSLLHFNTVGVKSRRFFEEVY